jgi:hypothetical protein
MTVRNKRTLDFINNTSKKYQSGEMTEETEEEPEQSLKLSVSPVISVCSVISLAAVYLLPPIPAAAGFRF